MPTGVHATTLLTASVLHLPANQEYGFARTDDGREVFFHKTRCRKVVGTAAATELTPEPSDDFGRLSTGHQPTKLVMLVERAQKGIRAIAWGIAPQRTWHDDYTGQHGLDLYVGGEVTVMVNGRHDGSIHRGTLKGALLTHARLLFELINVTAGSELVDPPEKMFDYRLDRAERRSAPNGQLHIVITGPDSITHILFYPYE